MALLVVWQKLTQRYKVVILQLKIIKLKEKVQVKGTNLLWNSSYFGRETVKDSFVDHSQQWHNEKVGHGTGSP